MTNVNVVAVEPSPLGGASNAGYRIGYIDSAAKVAQNDTWTVTNADVVLMATVNDDSAGTPDAVTISTNVLTLTGAATGAATGLVVYKEK